MYKRQLNGQTFNSIELTRAGFFDKTTYIGAVKDANDTWYLSLIHI